MKTVQYDVKYNMLLLGQHCIGKSKLKQRLTPSENKVHWNNDYFPSIGVDFAFRDENVNKKKVRFCIWDFASNEQSRSFAKSYIQKADGIFLVYSITKRSSFSHIEKLFEEIKPYLSEKVKLILVGNQCDEEENRVVGSEEGRLLAKEIRMEFIEVSAKTREGIMSMYQILAEKILCEGQQVFGEKEKGAVFSLRKKEEKTKCYSQ